QHTFSIGARYDIHERMAVKLQVDRVHAREYMFWTNVDTDWDGRATIVSATLDFTF
nr:hypothetical protein [Anaerolineae bacterium]